MFSFCVCLFFMYCLCEKYYKPITIQYYIADCVSCAPRLTLLDLRTRSQNGTCLYVGDIHTHIYIYMYVCIYTCVYIYGLLILRAKYYSII